MEGGRYPAHLGQAQRLQNTDVQPAKVEFPPLAGQLGGGGVGMMVVVQFLATDEKRCV